MSLNVPGLIGVVVFYLVVLAVGIWAGRKSIKSNNTDELFLASRNLGMLLSSLTIAGTNIISSNKVEYVTLYRHLAIQHIVLALLINGLLTGRCKAFKI